MNCILLLIPLLAQNYPWVLHAAQYSHSALAIQGLLMEWNFNQAEARLAFELAAQADPTAAMPHWGIAYALGPGANRCSCLSCSFYTIHKSRDLQALKEI